MGLSFPQMSRRCSAYVQNERYVTVAWMQRSERIEAIFAPAKSAYAHSMALYTPSLRAVPPCLCEKFRTQIVAKNNSVKIL